MAKANRVFNRCRRCVVSIGSIPPGWEKEEARLCLDQRHDAAEATIKKFLWEWPALFSVRRKPRPACPDGRLLLHQTGVAGNALPPGILKHPCVSEAPEVLVRSALIRAFGVIEPVDHCRITVGVYFRVLDLHQGGLELRIADVGQELASVTYFAIVFGVDKSLGHQPFERRGVAIDLGFVPQMFEYEQFAFLRIRAETSRLRQQSRGQQQATTNCPDHGALPIATFFAGANAAKR